MGGAATGGDAEIGGATVFTGGTELVAVGELATGGKF